MLVTMGAPSKCFEALPVLAVSSKSVKSRGTAAENIFSHRLALCPLDLDRVGNAYSWNTQ